MIRKLTLFLIMLFCVSSLAFETEEFRSLLIRVNFEDSGTNLTPPSSAALDSMAAFFKQNTQHRYEVHGHTCPDVGGVRFSAQRVEAMVDYLLANGVPVSNIVTITNPVRPEATEEGCTHDRRVDIMMIETRQRESKPEPEPVAVPEPEPVIIPEPVPIVIPAPPTPTPDPVVPEDGKQAVAIYMAGEEPQGARGVHNIMGGELARTLSESDRYLAVDRTDAILEQLAKEHTYQRSGAVDDEQIKALGQQFGVQYLCISDINPVGKRYYLDTRLVDVVTAEIMRSVTANSTLKDANEMTRVARNIASELIEPEATRQQRLRRKKIFRYTAIGLDIIGAGILAYGYYEETNVAKYVDETAKEPEAERAATRRNAAYIAGGAILASGITIHILF